MFDQIFEKDIALMGQLSNIFSADGYLKKINGKKYGLIMNRNMYATFRLKLAELTSLVFLKCAILHQFFRN